MEKKVPRRWIPAFLQIVTRIPEWRGHLLQRERQSGSSGHPTLQVGSSLSTWNRLEGANCQSRTRGARRRTYHRQNLCDMKSMDGLNAASQQTGQNHDFVSCHRARSWRLSISYDWKNRQFCQYDQSGAHTHRPHGAKCNGRFQEPFLPCGIVSKK